MEIIERTQKKFSAKIRPIGWGLVWLGVALYALGYITDAREAVFNNALNFLYLASIGIGALFFIALEYITGAVWSVPIRRVNEFLAQLVPFAALLAVPLLFNLDNLFVWARKDIAASDALLRLKEPVLKSNFFHCAVHRNFHYLENFYLAADAEFDAAGCNGRPAVDEN